MTTVHKLSKRGGGVTAKIKTPITKTENRTTNSKKQIQVCFLGLLQFKQNPHLEKALIDTFPRILAEATPRGPLWGIGLGLSDPLIRNRNTWRGDNWLGYLLTDVRNQIMEEKGMFSSVASGTQDADNGCN